MGNCLPCINSKQIKNDTTKDANEAVNANVLAQTPVDRDFYERNGECECALVCGVLVVFILKPIAFFFHFHRDWRATCTNSSSDNQYKYGAWSSQWTYRSGSDQHNRIENVDDNFKWTIERNDWPATNRR